MKALILCAGKGKRLRPLTNVLPKCLMPINGRPLLGYWLQWLFEAGIESVLINTHYLSDLIVDYIKRSRYSSRISFVYEPQLLGTGGTLLRNHHFFGRDPVMVIHGDNLSYCDYRSFIKSHQQRPMGTCITMMTFITQRPSLSGIVELDQKGVVVKFHEKVQNPPSSLANAATYIMEPNIFDFLNNLNKPEIDLSIEVIPNYLGKIYTFHNNNYHRDIGSFASYCKGQVEFPFGVNLSTEIFESGVESRMNLLKAREFLLSISEVLKADIRPLPNLNGLCELLDFDYPRRNAREKVVFVADAFTKKSDGAISYAKSEVSGGCNCYLFIRFVPKGFLSKSIYEKHGVVCFAFSTVTRGWKQNIRYPILDSSAGSRLNSTLPRLKKK